MAYSIKKKSGGPLSIFDGDDTIIVPAGKILIVEDLSDDIIRAVLSRNAMEIYIKKVIYKPEPPLDMFISLNEGFYTSAQTILLFSSTQDAIIRYTLDGTDPSDSIGIIYTGPFTISSNITVKAIASLKNRISSVIISKDYIINIPTVTDPIISPIVEYIMKIKLFQ